MLISLQANNLKMLVDEEQSIKMQHSDDPYPEAVESDVLDFDLPGFNKQRKW